MKTPIIFTTVIFAAGLSTSASAGTPWTINISGSYVSPKSDNGDLADGAFVADVSSEFGFTPSIQYAFSENIRAELLLAVPFEHDVSLTGGELIDSDAASFNHLPPTLSLKYVFMPGSAFSPYLGAGVNYTIVYDEETVGALEGAELSGDNSFGLALSLGFEYQIGDGPWSISGDLRYIDIDSDLELDGTDVGSIEVDPIVFSLGTAFSF